jgi:hypothetical protein
VIKESERDVAFYAWGAVENRYEWGTKSNRFVTIEGVCKECGFDPSPGQMMSVSKHLKKKGVRLLKHQGKRGALMPNLIPLEPR